MKKQTFLLLIMAIFMNNISAQIQKSPVGVQLYSFRDQFATDLPGTMQKIKDMGITYAETAGFYGKTVVEFKKILDEYSIKATGTSAEFADLEDPEKLNTIIGNAKTLGAKMVTCFWVPHAEYDFNLGDVEKAAKVFNKAGKALAANGISLLYHAHGYEFIPYKDMYLMDVLMAKTNTAYINFEMDILWTYHPGQNPVAWLKKYPNRYKALHVKDRRKNTQANQWGRMDVDNDVTLGEGDINVSDIIKQAKANKIQYYYIEDESARSLEQVPKSINYLRPFFK